jgi:hypothetical protein
MRKLVLAAAIASLIAVPSAFAHGKSTGHGRMHSSTSHASHRTHRHGKAIDGMASTNQANGSKSARGVGRHPDEEEVEVDELASKAN